MITISFDRRLLAALAEEKGFKGKETTVAEEAQTTTKEDGDVTIVPGHTNAEATTTSPTSSARSRADGSHQKIRRNQDST